MKKVVLLVLTFALLVGVSFSANVIADKDALYSAINAFESGQTITPDQKAMLETVNYNLNGSDELDRAGGPDDYGYIFVDSNDPNGPVYNWIDITGTGTEVAVDSALGDDDYIGPFPLGFTFNFYGVDYTDFYVQSNGAVTFWGGYLSYVNYEMPYAFYGATLAWFWNDFNPNYGTTGLVYYETTTVNGVNACVISFIDYGEYFTGYMINAQVIIFETGEVLYQYDSYDDGIGLTSSTTGIQNDLGDTGLTYIYNGSPETIAPGLAVEFYVDPNLEPATISGTVTDTDSGDPLEGVIVTIGTHTDTTDAAGAYDLSGYFAGFVYDVFATLDGYYDYADTFTPVAGANVYDFTMDIIPPPPEPDYFDDFEAGQGDWTVDFVNTAWEYGEPVVDPAGAYSPTHCWATHIDTEYNVSEVDSLISTISWTISSQDAYVSYWHHYYYEGYWDGYNFQISTDGGATWTILTPADGYSYPGGVYGLGYEPGFSGMDAAYPDWSQAFYYLGDYEGMDVMFMFRHGTDASITYPGMAFDDFAVYTGGQAPGPLTLDIWPVDPPIVIPAAGGSFQFDATVTNNTPNLVQFQAWTTAQLPNGNELQNPIWLGGPFNLPGNTTVGPAQPMTVDVPGFAPPGTYTFIARVGLYPTFVADEDSFPFEKSTTGVASGVFNDWDAYGPDWVDGTVVSNDLLPTEFSIENVYPNPFNPTTTVSIALPSAANLQVSVFNMLGQQVAVLANGRYSEGYHNLTFNGSNLSSGIYFIQASVPGMATQMHKVMLVK